MGGLISRLLFRLFQALSVAAVVSTVTFGLIVMMPGDIALEIAAARYGVDLADEQTADYVRKQEGLDQPIYLQYARWLAATLRLDLGRSVVSGKPVAAELRRHFGYTLKLAVGGMLLSVVLALPLGIACGLSAGSWLDMVSAAISCALVSIPSYVLGAGLIFIAAINWRLLPAAGFSTTANLVLPSLTLALALCATSNRVIRTSVAGVKASFHTVFASMKNLPQSRIILGHVLRNASVPVATFLGLQFAHLLDGVVVVEVLFNYPGIGKTLLTAIMSKDLPMLQGAVLVIGLMYVTINALTDLLCIWIDPRQNQAAS
jgi:peptide/nickel transport system permease protein